MSDKAQKAKPKAERIARMEGSTAYRDPRDGFARGAIDITDQDVMAALAMIRKSNTSTESGDPNDIGPELLETYYGSTGTHRRLLVARFMREQSGKRKTGVELIQRRLATTLAVQTFAGASLTREQWHEYAYIAHSRRETMEAFHADALRWFEERLSRALLKLMHVLSPKQPTDWKKMKEAPDRAKRIADKIGRKVA